MTFHWTSQILLGHITCLCSNPSGRWLTISYLLRTLNLGFSLEHMATSTTVGLKSAGRMVDKQLMDTSMYFE